MGESRLLILGARDMQRAAFEAARERRIATVAVDPDANASCRSLADRFYTADLGDFDTLEKIAIEAEIDGVVTLAADYPVLALGHLCEKLGLPGPSIEAVRTVCNKGRLRRKLADTALSGPRFEIFASVAETSQSELLAQTACIIKPVDSSGGRGVSLLARGATAEEISTAATAAAAHSRDGSLIVEEFIEGSEFSAEAFTIEGRTTTVAITEKLTSGPPYFLEIGHIVPAELDASKVKSVESFVADVVRATGLDNSASHIELKLTTEGPVLIEIAARLGGGFINTDLVPLATGVNMVAASIDIALGRRPDLTCTLRQSAAIRFLIPPRGQLAAIDGLKRASTSKGVHRIVCDYRPGEEIPAVRDATGRKCYVISTGTNAAAARNAVDDASSLITFKAEN